MSITIKNSGITVSTVKQRNGDWSAEEAHCGIFSSGATELEALGKVLIAIGESNLISDSVPITIERGTRFPGFG